MIFNRTIPYAVELDGSIALHSDGKLESLNDLSLLKGDCRVVSDFQDAIARTMTVEADTRYVELMISRKLQETGEFDEPVTVITHWKKKRGKNTSDIYFTAVAAKRYFRYLEMVGEYKDHLILLPLQSLLLTMLKKFGKDRPIAAVLQHGRFADILIGTHHKIWYANRVVAFDDSREQIRALWETVRTDIDTQSHEHHQSVEKVFVATWVDSGPLPQWSDENAPEVILLEEHVLVQDGQEVKASLPAIIDEIPTGQAVAPSKEKILYAARRALPYLNALFLAAAVCLGGTGAWYQYQSAGLEAQIQAGLQQARAIEAKAPAHIKPVPYESTFAFVKELWSCRRLPTYNQILEDVGQGVHGILRVKNIKAEYSDNKVEVKAFGSASAPFESSYKAYQDLRQKLSKRGYTMLDDRFDTRINVSDFVLRFAKEVR